MTQSHLQGYHKYLLTVNAELFSQAFFINASRRLGPSLRNFISDSDYNKIYFNEQYSPEQLSKVVFNYA